MVASKVTVRMYNTGFGDAFVVTVARGSKTWRMLVDCGVHQNDTWRDINEVVTAIVKDLSDVTDQKPHLDVVVATHRHTDHISGFLSPEWEKVTVGEVWLPYIENKFDPDGNQIRTGQHALAERVAEIAQLRLAKLDADANDDNAKNLKLALDFAVNSRSKEEMMKRLLKPGFKGQTEVKYLPYKDPAKNEIQLPVEGARIHILGPTRKLDGFNREDPSSKKAWPKPEQLPLALRIGDSTADPHFDASYELLPENVDPLWKEAIDDMNLEYLLDPTGALLDAAAALEWSVNNTSVIFVLEVGDLKLLFVGDAQQDAWDKLMADDHARELISNPDFYKIGHHGSHNATTMDYVDQAFGSDPKIAMMGWREPIFKSIPRPSLIEALKAHGADITRSEDAVEHKAGDTTVKVNGNIWSEVTLATEH